MPVKARLLRYYAYLKRAHVGYFSFLLNLVNFITIQYFLLVKNFPFLERLFPDLGTFALTVIAVYVPVAIAIGRWDYKRGSAVVETGLAARANPWRKTLAKSLFYMLMEDREKAMKALEGWVDD